MELNPVPADTTGVLDGNICKALSNWNKMLFLMIYTLAIEWKDRAEL